MGSYDLVVRGGDVVFPGDAVRRADIAIRDGSIVAIGAALNGDAAETIDATGRHVLPGVVDSHFHLGIFRPLAEDARTESGSAAAGGVTSALIYHRAGRNNLFADTAPAMPGPYGPIAAGLLDDAAGNFWCDYGFHVAPVTQAHVAEMPELVSEHGITTFKYYMHYRGIAPDIAPSPGEKEYVFTDSGYDLGHLHAMMVQVAQLARDGLPARVSVHAEHPAIIRENTVLVRNSDTSADSPLQIYSRTRPPSGERLAILLVAELADQTGCPVNILHISSAAALGAIREARSRYPTLDLMAETTVHHLLLANDEYGEVDGKVNPPIRTSTDRDALWAAVTRGEIQTTVSDHAAIDRSRKGDDIWTAWYGFGGTELLLPAVLTEGHVRRHVPLERLADLLSRTPARFHGVSGRKGDIAVGLDADLAICEIGTPWTVDHRKLHSAQDFSPFDGAQLSVTVETTIVRGRTVYRGGELVGERRGEYLRRPC